MNPRQIANLVRQWCNANRGEITAKRISDLVHHYGACYGYTAEMEAETLGILSEVFPCVHQLTKV